MRKSTKVLLASSAALVAYTLPAHAVCPGVLVLKDAVNTQANGKYTDDGSGNCMVNTAEQDGAQATIGSKADSAWASGSGSVVAIGKAIANNTAAAIPSGSNTIGKIDILGNAGATLDGTAGSPATAVLSVQGVTGGTQLNTGNTFDPCASAAKTNFALSSTSTNVQVIAGASSKKVYICSISVVSSTASAINFIEGQGTTCTTAASAAVIGSTTEANGLPLVANSIFSLGNGNGTVGVTATSANGICILQSVSQRIAGNVTFVQQ